jgi:hypothetical protein
MSGMKIYHLSRAVISAAFGGLFILAGSVWWQGVLAGGLAFAWFLVAPHIGRYAVHPERGVTALQRDERAQTINNAAGRNAFIVSMLAAAGVIIYAGARSLSSVPVSLFQWLLALGVLIYYASDFWLRRTQS